MGDYPPCSSLILCATPRSGSTLLCRALAESGLAGHPDEFFPERGDMLQTWAGRVGAATPNIYVEQLVRRTATANGVFATKLFAHQIPVLRRLVSHAAQRRSASQPAGLRGALALALGEVSFVRLKRRDRDAQAISYYRAAASGDWVAPASGASIAPPTYDPLRLSRFKGLLDGMERVWDDFFLTEAIQPLTLTYEDLGEDLGRDIGLVLDFCRIERPPALHAPRGLTRQADATSAEWDRRLRAEPLAAGPDLQRFCLLCNTPGAPTEALAQALRATGLIGGLRPVFALADPARRGALEAQYGPAEGAGYMDAVLARAAAARTGVGGAVLNAAHTPALRQALSRAFGAAEARGMPISALLGGWGLQACRVALRWGDRRLQAAAMYVRRWGEPSADGPDTARLDACLAEAARAEQAWREALADEPMPTLQVEVEELARFPATTLNAIATFCTGREQALEDTGALKLDLGPAERLLARLVSPTEAPGGQAKAASHDVACDSPLRAGDLIAYVGVSAQPPPPLVPAAKTRAWMDAPAARFAYRCLPMVIANQSGWMVLATETVIARWTGSTALDGVQVSGESGGSVSSARSSFGHGVLTFLIPYLFRTGAGVNLIIRGPPNLPRDGVFPLEGVVETDASEATFTMNWRFTRPDLEVRFEKGEPIAMIAPVQRGFLDGFSPRVQTLEGDADLRRRQGRWAFERVEFKAQTQAAAAAGDLAAASDWQKSYMRGRTVDGLAFPEHETTLKLKPFAEG